MFGANAFRKKLLVARATGATRDQAIAEVKQELDKLDAIDLSERDEEGAPSSEKYEKAFATILPKIADSYMAMLTAHLRAPDYLISATQLAEAAGYSGYEGANLHYGKLGLMIDALMRSMDTAHFQWQMRPQVVEALKLLGL